MPGGGLFPPTLTLTSLRVGRLLIQRSYRGQGALCGDHDVNHRLSEGSTSPFARLFIPDDGRRGLIRVTHGLSLLRLSFKIPYLGLGL